MRQVVVQLKNLSMIAILCGAVAGCSRNIPPPPLNTSMSLDATQEQKLPFVDPGLPAGDLENASDEERDQLIQLQHQRMREQQKEVEDLRRQKFQDGYYKYRYPRSGE